MSNEVKKANKPRKYEKEIDWQIVDAMLLDMMSGNQIAARLKISARTLQNRCKKVHGVNFDVYKDRMRVATIQRIASAQIKAAIGYKFEATRVVEKYKVDSQGRKIVTSSTQETKSIFFPPDAKLLVHLGQQYLGQKPIAAERAEDPRKPTGYIIEDEDGKVIEMPEFKNEPENDNNDA